MLQVAVVHLVNFCGCFEAFFLRDETCIFSTIQKNRLVLSFIDGKYEEGKNDLCE